MKYKVSCINLVAVTLVFLKNYAVASNKEGINGGRSIEADMVPVYEKMLHEIQRNLVLSKPPTNASTQAAATDLCPDLRARLSQINGKAAKLITLDERMCERIEGNACLSPKLWRARSILRQQLASVCGVQEPQN